MDKKTLEAKLAALRAEVHKMETHGADVISARRVLADMGDDPRENEGAKLVMEQHDIWYIRKVELKKAIVSLKLQIAKLK